MASTLKLALGEMSARRQLLLQSLIERVGEQLSPRWVLAHKSQAADMLLFDPALGEPETSIRALPVVERAAQASVEGLSLCFPPTTAEFRAFLDKAAQPPRATVPVLPAGLQALADAVPALIAGRREGVVVEAEDGLRFGLSAVYGAPRVHMDPDGRLSERISEPGLLLKVRVLADAVVTGSGSLQQGQLFVWALARELARHAYPLVPVDAVLKLRRWPLPPEPFIARSDCMRICMRLAPGSADLRSLEQSEQYATADAMTLINAGVMLGFLRAEAAPADASVRPVEAPVQPRQEGRYGTLMSALRSAFGLAARAH